MSNGYSPKGEPGSIMHPSPPPKPNTAMRERVSLRDDGSLSSGFVCTNTPFKFESAYERNQWVALVTAALHHVDGYEAVKAADVVSHELRARRKESEQ